MPLIKKSLPVLQVPAKPAPQDFAEAVVGHEAAQAEEPKKTGGIRRRKYEAIKTTFVELTGEIADVVAAVKKNYSPMVITHGTSEKVSYGRLSTGILAADLCLAGGWMKSRGHMVYGNKSAGKSTLSYRTIAAAQREFPDQIPALIDIEGTYDPAWAKRHHVDTERLLLVEPETGESAVDIADGIVRAKEVSLVVTDSIAFLTPMKEIQGSAEDSNPGIHARLIGNYLRRLNASLLTERHRGHFPTVLHLNQFRMSIGVMFGDPRVLPGGKALEFATTQQMEISNKEITNASKDAKAKKGEAPAAGSADSKDADKNATVIYNEHSFKITKDKSGGRYKEGRFKLIRDESQGFPVGHIEQSRSIINFGFNCGLLEGAPQSFGFVDKLNNPAGFQGKFRGAPELAQFLVEDHDRELAIVKAIVETYRARWGVT